VALESAMPDTPGFQNTDKDFSKLSSSSSSAGVMSSSISIMQR
jgi:hypothetical protein